MTVARVSKFWPNGQRVNSTGESPGSETCWVWEGLLDCAVSLTVSHWGPEQRCLMVHWSLSVTPGLSVTATNTDNVTLDRIGVEAATPEVKTQLTVRMRGVQFNSIISPTPLNPSLFVSFLLSISSPFFSVHGPLNKSGSRGGWTHQLVVWWDCVCVLINSVRHVTGWKETGWRAAVPESFNRSSDEQALKMNFPVCIAKLNWYPIMFPHIDKLTEQLWAARACSVRIGQAQGREAQDLEGDVTRRPESAAWVSDGPHACLKAWHCRRGKNTILSFSAIRTLSPCQTCHMSPSQVVLLAYRVWQGYSHTAPNQTPSPAEKKKNHHHSTVTGCQAEGTNLHRALAESLPIWGRGQRPGVTMGDTAQASTHPHTSCTLALVTLILCYSISNQAEPKFKSIHTIRASNESFK